MLLFDDFETLDAFGPVEVLGKVEEYRLRYFSEHGGTVASAQKTVIVTEPATEADGLDRPFRRLQSSVRTRRSKRRSPSPTGAAARCGRT